LTCAIVALLLTPAAQAQEFGASLALSAANGTYDGGYRLSGVYLFAGLDAAAGPVRLWASVPFVWSSSSVGTIDPVTGLPGEEQWTSTGFGDPLLRVDLRLVNDVSRGLQVAVAGSVKPALVDPSSGLGTGATDFALGGAVFKQVGRSSVFADVLYWKYGDPEGAVIEDAFSYSVGVGRILGTGRWSSMATLSGMSKGVDGGPAPMQVNLAALRLVGRGQSLAFSGSIGLRGPAGGYSVSTSWRAGF